jgi:hypothetical protein
MLKLLLRQPINQWKDLSFRVKLEVILLGGLIFMYIVTRSQRQFYVWTETGGISLSLLSSIIVQSFISILFLSSPLVMNYLIPGQLSVFYGKPIRKNSLYSLLFYYSQKYQLTILIAALLLLIGLAIVRWPFAAAAFFVLLLYKILIFFLVAYLRAYSRNSTLIIGLAWLIAVLQAIPAILSAGSVWFWVYQCLFLLSGAFAVFAAHRHITELHLEIFFPLSEKKFRHPQKRWLSFHHIPRLLPPVLHALFSKELLGLWRNRAYRRLKTWTLIIYIALLLLLSIQDIPEKDKWLTILTGILIWLHYSHHFSEKYVQPEPAIFFHTIPLRFYQVWLSKFLVEALYMLILLSTYWFFLIFSGNTLAAQVNLIGALLVFSFLLLSTMLNFQIMFYDDPRLAGYGFHFTMLFLLALTLNDKLVGPLVGLALLSFYFYKSYRYFTS